MNTPEPDTPPPARILTAADLEDPGRFVRIAGVPLLDVHTDEDRGDVDPELLALLARNTNDRAARGEFAPVLLGHTVDGDEFPEVHQPPVIGYTANFHIKPYNHTPCLHGDLYVHREHYSRLPTYPHRSVERMKGQSDEMNWIDAVSLLRKAPERPLGKLTYSRADLPPGTAVVRYARDLGALADGPRPRPPAEYDHLAAEVAANLRAHAAGCERAPRRGSARADLMARLERTISRRYRPGMGETTRR